MTPAPARCTFCGLLLAFTASDWNPLGGDGSYCPPLCLRCHMRRNVSAEQRAQFDALAAADELERVERTIGRDLLRLAAGCEARGQRWTLCRSHCTGDGPDGAFYVAVLVGPEKGRTIPFTSASLPAVVEAAARFVGERS